MLLNLYNHIGAFGDFRVIGHVCLSVFLFVCLFVDRFPGFLKLDNVLFILIQGMIYALAAI